MQKQQLRIGLRVVSNREFSGVAVGTPGEVVAATHSWPETDSVAISWDRPGLPPQTDWFSFDDLVFLDTDNPNVRNPRLDRDDEVCDRCDYEPGRSEADRREHEEHGR